MMGMPVGKATAEIMASRKFVLSLTSRMEDEDDAYLRTLRGTSPFAWPHLQRTGHEFRGRFARYFVVKEGQRPPRSLCDVAVTSKYNPNYGR